MNANELDISVTKDTRRWDDFEIKKKARNVSIGIPTKDFDVRNIFRLLKEPICLFGEDNYDRRTRLTRVLIDKYDRLVNKQGKEEKQEEKEKKQEGKENDKRIETETNLNAETTTQAEIEAKELEQFFLVLKKYYIDLSIFFEQDSADYTKIKQLEEEVKKKIDETSVEKKTSLQDLDSIKEKFYTESTEELRLSRIHITLYTLPRIYKYKSIMHTFQEKCTKEEYETYINKFNEHMKSNLELHISQFGDNRPLTSGRFSPNNLSFAVSSYNTHLSVFNYQEDNYDLITYLTGGHEDKVNDICWNYPSNYSYYSTVSYDQIEKDQMLLASCSSDKSFCLWKPFLLGEEETALHQNKTHRISGMDENQINCDTNAKLLWKMKAHDDRINKILFHPLNKYIMTCSEDETIKFFDIEERKELFYQEGHNSNVYSIAFNPFGNLYLSGDTLGGLMFWDIRTGRNIAKKIVHTNTIMNISFNPFFPNMFCTSSADNTIKVFDLRSFSDTYKILAHTKIVTDAIYEPMYGRYIASSSFDTYIKIWDSINFYCTKVIYNNDSKVKNVDISPDGNFLSATSLDRTWKLYKNVSNLKECFTLPLPVNELATKEGA